MDDTNGNGTIAIVGASRGLGLAMAEECLRRGWNVLGTARQPDGTGLHALAAAHPGRVEIEPLEIRDEAAIAALRARLSGRVLDILFVNAGITNRDPAQTIGEVRSEDFVEVMLTNALGPMRVVERLADLVPADGVIGVMSSGQGSIANNESGQRELYRGSKAALNMFLRSFAARTAPVGRAMLAVAPGWVRTDLGGPDAPLAIGDSIPGVVDLLLAARGTRGLRYLDHRGRTVPW